MKSKLNKKLKSKIEQLVHLFWVWITRVNQKSAPLTGTFLTGTPLTDNPLKGKQQSLINCQDVKCRITSK